MTFQRDLAWQNLDYMNKSSIAHQYARYALNIKYDVLPEEVIHQAKRCLLDALGCAIGACFAPGRKMCEDMVKKLGGIEEATVIGSGFRTSAANATIVNSFLVRFLDYNDFGSGGHLSDSIPGVLAVAEREKASGRDLLTSLVIPYELGERFAKAAAGNRQPSVEGDFALDIKAAPGFREVSAGLIMPAALGKLMGLSEEEIANAIGVCASHSISLGILDADQEECTMSKNLRYGWNSYNAILSCLLAKEGFTGPVRVFEGEKGLEEAVYGKGKVNLQEMLDFSGWHIMKIRHKVLPVCAEIIGHALAIIEIVKEHDLKPDEIATIEVKTNQLLRHTTWFAKKYPRNVESADHSTYYAIAIAIIERKITPESFEPEKFIDPMVLDLIEKIRLEADPSLSISAAEVTITTKDGSSFHKDIPHVFANDPLSDIQLEEKFKRMAERYMKDEQIQRIFDNVWNVEKLDDIGGLMRLLIFK